MGLNLFALFKERFDPHGGKRFLAVPGQPSLTFDDIDRLSMRFSAVLKERGVQRGERVLVQADKSPNSIGLYLACLRLGAVYVPLNTAYTGEEIDYFLCDARPAMFVCRPESFDELRVVAQHRNIPAFESLGTQLAAAGGSGELANASLNALGGPHVGSLDRNANEAQEDGEIVDVRSDDLAAMLYTSGTTGKPKGAMLTHGNLAENGKSLYQCWDWRTEDVLLHALPIFHVHGLFVALHCALLGASTVVFLPRFDVAAVRAALADCSVMMGVPTFYVRLLADEEFSASEVSHMRLFISGSAPLTEQTARAFNERTGHHILERYGMSETGITASNPVEGERVPGTVGFAAPNVELRVTDEEGHVVAPGKVGMVEVRGGNVFKGYWEQPEKTASEFREDGFFVTGDLGVMDEEGRLSIVGRDKDLIISGGYNVYPKELESCIDQVEGVQESAVFGVPHVDFGEAVVAVVVAEPDRTVEQAISEALSSLARFKHPKKLMFCADLPRNAMGKVQKNLLREQYRNLFHEPL